ncbi:MAG TPA: sigma-70 family RNA polymerase sigma factor [Candidatus Eisenbacteria bacterium]|nr:sigma-70 family RNA polymerase sigma factor [Candidatus Eisenbacteria bacterium]
MAAMAPQESPLEATATLLTLIRGGDLAARERLLSRIYRPLIRFAHGRLPWRARDLTDTEDLVQVALLRALDHIEEFDSRREGAFMAYLRSILLNLVRDEARRVSRRPEQEEMGEDLATSEPSPLEVAVGREALERYDAALAKLSEEQHEAVVLRVEMGYTYAQIAEAMALASTDSARMMVTRAIARMGRLMRPPEFRRG